ncbi:hypothetical protein BC629DRAFT_72341 [Irpex lacteus]|nr:hypothetical protein BC629DRAFT_72341 [Irpex lacteus]
MSSPSPSPSLGTPTAPSPSGRSATPADPTSADTPPLLPLPYADTDTHADANTHSYSYSYTDPDTTHLIRHRPFFIISHRSGFLLTLRNTPSGPGSSATNPDSSSNGVTQASSADVTNVTSAPAGSSSADKPSHQLNKSPSSSRPPFRVVRPTVAATNRLRTQVRL